MLTPTLWDYAMGNTVSLTRPYLLTPALLAISVSASAGNWEVGGHFGYANNRDGVADTNRYFTAASIQARMKSDDGRRRSWSLYINYPLSGQLSAQLGYADLGGANTSVIGKATEVDPYLNSLSHYPIDNIRGSYLAGIYRFPLNDMVSVSTKGGLYYWQADFTLRSEQRSLIEYRSGISPMLGIGVALTLTRQLAGVVQWDLYAPDGHVIDVMTLGLAWRFR
ncbi:MAG TPA: hypothetical protein ENK35_04155 [Candidatus Tenderia sp.]|nr:hypothetical protein [Candidatus Tenderia sp.]